MSALPLRRILPFFAATFLWNAGLGMSYVLVPLKAYHLGLSGVAIGALLALPAILQTVFNLIGGVAADRLGGRTLVLGSTAVTALAGAGYLVAEGFAMMFAAQILVSAGRSMFWPATWSITSQFGGNMSERMGWLNSAANGGNITGAIGAGAILAASGFVAGFAGYIAVNLAALAGFIVFRGPARGGAATPVSLATYARYARRPVMLYAMMCAYVSAVPFTLSASFYPILFAERGFASEANGLLVSLRGVGAVICGLALARFIQRIDQVRTPFVASAITGAMIAASAWFGGALAIGAVVLALGLFSTIVTTYFQVLVAGVSSPTERGQAMALGGLGWSLSHIGTPLLMGVLKDRLGITEGFYAFGLAIVVWGLMLIPVQRWAFAGGTPR